MSKLRFLTYGLCALSVSGAAFGDAPQFVNPGQGARAAAPRETAEVQTAVETVKERYPDGSIRLVRGVALDTENNYVNHGVWKLQTPAGTPVAVGRFKMGEREGDWIRRHDDGGIFQIEPYSWFHAPFYSKAGFRNGTLHGKWTVMDSKDRIVSEIDFVDGKREGVARWYYPLGKLLRESYYKNGELHGSHRIWNKAGEVVLEHNYQDGKRESVHTTYYDEASERIRSAITYIHPRSVLVRADDWWEARFAEYKSDGELVQHGTYSYYYPNGQLKARGNYDMNAQIGQWNWWHENGLRAISGQYENAKPAHVWRWWNEKGELAKSIDYDESPSVSPFQEQPITEPVEELSAPQETFNEPPAFDGNVPEAPLPEARPIGWVQRQQAPKAEKQQKTLSIREMLEAAKAE